ncbi:hypothetical protein Peur_018624 [Populus x canadensis]
MVNTIASLTFIGGLDLRNPRGIALGTLISLAGALTLKRNPVQLSLTTWMSFAGAAQSAVFTVIVQHKRAAWTIGFDIDFWSIVYGGIVVYGSIIFVKLVHGRKRISFRDHVQSPFYNFGVLRVPEM